MAQRWDNDTRGYGVASGEVLLPELDRLRTAMTSAAWIAEEPEVHLLPHIRQACERDGSPWTLLDAGIEDAVLTVALKWRGIGNKADLRADAMALLGSFIESNTFVRQSDRGDETVFDAVTGVLDGDGPFAGHGHLVRFVITRDA